MDRKRYEKLVGEYRALSALGFRQYGKPTTRAIYSRMCEIEQQIGAPAINRSYVSTMLQTWDVLEYGHADALCLGSRNRMKNHPTPNLKGI